MLSQKQRILILDFGGDKSFADDLNTELGAVSSRVALLLRSAEAKPTFSRFVSVAGYTVGREVMRWAIDARRSKSGWSLEGGLSVSL